MLIDAHNPVAIAFVAHYNCAGHPVSETEHDEHSQQMMEFFSEELNFKGYMVAYCATYKSDIDWPLKEVARVEAE